MKERNDAPLPPVADNPNGNILFNIRGTNGSGKSYAMRKLMGDAPVETIMEGPYKVLRCGGTGTPLYVIGAYDTACGGLDTVKRFEETQDMALKYIELGNVAMEGVLWSTVFKSSYELDAKLRALGHRMIWIMMNTPLELGLTRLMQRRAEKGNMEPFDPEKVVAKQKAIIRTYNRALSAGVLGFHGDADRIAKAVGMIIDKRVWPTNSPAFTDASIDTYKPGTILNQPQEVLDAHAIKTAPTTNDLSAFF